MYGDTASVLFFPGKAQTLRIVVIGQLSSFRFPHVTPREGTAFPTCVSAGLP